MEQITQFEGPLLIIAALIIMGRGIKAVGWIPDKLIPTLLPLTGAALNCWRECAITWDHIAIGLTLGATAVWGNQWYRQVFSPAGQDEPPKPDATVIKPTTGTTAMLVAGLMGLSMLSGCATFETRSYQSLSAISLTVDAARLSYLDYTDTHGVDEAKDKAIRSGYANYQWAMRMAKAIIIEHKKSTSTVTDAQVTKAITDVAVIADNLIGDLKAASKEKGTP
jgi:hypothetical protein